MAAAAVLINLKIAISWPHFELQLKIKYISITYFLCNISAKNFRNRTVYAKIIASCNKKASILWQDSARRQIQAGLKGDVGL